VRGLVLRVVRGVLHGVRTRRWYVPDPRPARRADAGGELLLPPVRVRRPAPRALRGPSGGRAAGGSTQRGPVADPRGPAGLLDQPHVVLMGRADPMGPQAR